MYYRPSSVILPPSSPSSQGVNNGNAPKQRHPNNGNIYEDTYASIQEPEMTIERERANPPSLLIPKNTADLSVPGHGENRYEAIPPGTFERENGYTKIKKQQKNDLPSVAPQKPQPPQRVNSNTGEPQVKQFQMKQPSHLKNDKIQGYEEVGTTIKSGPDVDKEDGSMKRGYDKVGSVLM